MSFSVKVFGVDDVVERLQTMGTVATPKAMRSALSAAMTYTSRAVKRQIAATPIIYTSSRGSRYTASMKRGMIRSVRKRIAKTKKKIEGKVGYSVAVKAGSKGSGVRWSHGRTADNPRSVGVASSTVHWFVLGTADRRTKKGAYRGKMPAFFKTTLQDAIRSAAPGAFNVAINKVIEIMNKEWEGSRS